MNKNLTEEEFDELIYDNEEQALIFFHKEGCNACGDVSVGLKGLKVSAVGRLRELTR